MLSSAVQKIAKVAIIPEGKLFFRGLPRLMELPAQFFIADKQGRRGFLDFGFVSTTEDKNMAIQYAGGHAVTGGPIPMVIIMQATAVDRGASVKDLSQYPQELHRHFGPCCDSVYRR